jgi:hypothetical protein
LLEYYRLQPEITFAEHLAALEEEMAREALAKKRVYLDLRYWIYLRDASLGSPKRDVHAQLLEVLISGVDRGSLVCPITDSVFFELDRQGATERRMQTVRIIDRLSKGVVIKNVIDRFRCEVIDFLEAATIRREIPTRPCRKVWVKPYSFLGTPRITDGWPDTEQLAINKALVSYMWTRSIEDLLADTPVPAYASDIRLRKDAERITSFSTEHAEKMRSFAQVFAAEVGGFVNVRRKVIFNAFKWHMGIMFPGAAGATDGLTEEVCANVVYNIVKRRPKAIELPLVRIEAGLRANIRWNRKRPFKFQDFFDIDHAAAAIPYCDVFLTEADLKAACTNGNLDFANVFGTEIISNEGEALRAVSRLAA